MEVPYTKVRSIDPHYQYFLPPLLNIRILRGSTSFSLKGHLDTGADQTLINSGIAKAFSLDWKRGKQSVTYGISGDPLPIYIHELEIEVIGLANSKVKTNVAFINSPRVGVLLGQLGFFEHFKVTFERYRNVFQVELKP